MRRRGLKLKILINFWKGIKKKRKVLRSASFLFLALKIKIDCCSYLLISSFYNLTVTSINQEKKA